MNASHLTSHRLNNALHATLLLGGMAGLLAVIGWVINGATGVLWTGAVGLIALLLTPRISPALILRMYRARPLAYEEVGGLYDLVNRLAAAAQLSRAPRLYYVPTQLMNAFSVGRRHEAVIAVTDGLLRGLSAREMTAVMAHEISHIGHNDMWIMSLADGVSRMVRVLSFIGQVLILINLPMFLLQYQTLPWAPLLLLVFAPTLSALLQLALSRNREFDADLEAVRLTGDSQGLAQALQKLSLHQERMWRHLLLPGRQNKQPSLLRTHPSSRERIERLQALEPTVEPFMAGGLPSHFLPAQWAVPLQAPRHRWSGLWY